jgi:hypothetical protein
MAPISKVGKVVSPPFKENETTVSETDKIVTAERVCKITPAPPKGRSDNFPSADFRKIAVPIPLAARPAKAAPELIKAHWPKAINPK